MKNSKYLLPIITAGVLVFQSCGNSNSGKTDSTEQASQVNEQKDSVDNGVSDFMVKAAAGGMAEVELGKLAQENGVSQRVKDYGAMMVKDHTKANDELKALASAKNITLPATLDDQHQKHFEEMKKMKGADFDKHYMDMMVNDHVETINLFDDAAKNETDAEIKAFAAKTAPVLKIHLDSAKKINEAVKK
ncbi:DUF4142 domain-containing protein [Pararcticibacter amylolyticus]|uniref:DUF305 domain-containing protein n=1 Tax=Pararcticibacter amylolyticus TaxID=2173175 RepID=A0A2U2PL35_9SPHI|nr:DUF4142 domain-containing protein [Pararcticibacter amylolyticus]PWG82038.1 DUF305 domain-containing protein [Pararcticibacter amylolyticus]